MTASLYDLKGRATTTPIPSGAVLIGAVSEDAANPVLFDASSLVAQSDAFTTPQAHGAVADGVTDDLAAFVAALATGKKVVVPSGTYAISSYIEPPSGARLIGFGNPTIKVTVSSRFLRVVSKTDIRIEGINFDATTTGLTNNGCVFHSQSDNIHYIDCTFDHAYSTFTITGSNSYENHVVRCRFLDTQNTHGLTLNDGAHDNRVEDCDFLRCAFNGIRGSLGTNRNLIIGNRGYNTGGELVAFEKSTHHDRIIGNHAENTGDNGFSYSGSYGTLVGNVAYKCYFFGIYLYGRQNTCVGNQCLSNGQASIIAGPYFGLEYAGIGVGGYWGGLGIYNIVQGNVCDDDQAAPTQYSSIKLAGNSYTDWTSGDTISGASANTPVYRLHELNLYQTTGNGATGSTAPTHTTGTVSDGGISWTYVDSYVSAREAYRNTIGPNRCITSISGLEVQDGTANNSNFILRDSMVEFVGAFGRNTVSGGFQRRTNPWTSGEAITAGNHRYGSNLVIYRCSNLGGSCSVEPTHSSGTATGADGIEWTVAAVGGQAMPFLELSQDGVQIRGPLYLESISSTLSFVTDGAAAGTPEGKVTAPVGSTWRRTDGGAGTCFYVKESGSGATGWVAK